MSAPEPPVRVLVVDDDDQLRESLMRIFRRRGLEAEGARDGQEALEVLGGHAFDVVLCDLSMPRMTGGELLDRLLAARTPCQVVLMTGVHDLRVAVAAMRRGAFGLLAKPFGSYQEVLLEVLDAARLNRLRDG